jgi:hypothetical protein
MDIAYVLVSETSITWQDLKEVTLPEAIFLADRIQARKKREYEQDIGKDILMTNIATAPHAKNGARELINNLKSEMYIHRELAEGEIEPDSKAEAIIKKAL